MSCGCHLSLPLFFSLARSRARSLSLSLPSRRTQARHLAHPRPPLRPPFRPDRLAATHYAAKTAEAPRAAAADRVPPPAAGAAARLARLPLGGRAKPPPTPAPPDRRRTSDSPAVQAAAASARSGLDRACAPAAATWTEEVLKNQCASIFLMQGYFRKYFSQFLRPHPCHLGGARAAAGRRARARELVVPSAR